MKKRLLFLITEDWFFCSHFFERALAAQAAGYEVAVATRAATAAAEKIRQAGFTLLPLNWSRRGTNLLAELKFLWALIALYRRYRPHIVHQIAVKPILYGSLAARLCRIPAIVNAPVGMGYVFSSDRLLARVLRPGVVLAYRLLLNPVNSRVIFENPDDLGMMARTRLVARERCALIRGAGVDLERFAPRPEPEGPPVVMLASRMLWDKGVGEFVEAARRLREQGVQARFVLVGDSDFDNPAVIPRATLEAWRDSGVVEWWGHSDRMHESLAQSSVVCLPSYREGLPKVLLEAAASGRPIVATDVPGCREAVRVGGNGFLVPAKDPVALAEALARLIGDAGLRKRMGEQSRSMAVSEFSVETVAEQTLCVYEEMQRA